MNPKPTGAPPNLNPATTDETLAAIYRALRRDPADTSARLQSQREVGAAMIATLRPRDAIEAAYTTRACLRRSEAALASRRPAAAAHFGSLESLHRGMLPDLPDNAGNRLRGKAVALSRMSSEMIRQVTHRRAASSAQKQPAAEAVVAGQPEGAVDRGLVTSTHITRAGGQGHGAAGANAAGEAAFFGRKDPMSSERPPPAGGAAIMARLEVARLGGVAGRPGGAEDRGPAASTYTTRAGRHRHRAAGADPVGAAGFSRQARPPGRSSVAGARVLDPRGPHVR